MKNRDIEKMLTKAGDNFVPNVLGKVMANSAEQEGNADVIVLQPDNRRNKTKVLIIAILALSILVIGALTGGHFYLNGTDSLVYIDINPSVELTLNRAGNVKSVSAKNAEAEALLVGQSLKGLSLEDATQRILELAIEQKYIDSESQDNEITFTLLNDNLKKADKQMAKLDKHANQFFGNKGITCNIGKETCNKKDHENGIGQGVSPIKLRVIESIIAIDPSYTIDSLKDYKLRDLKKLLKQLTENDKDGRISIM